MNSSTETSLPEEIRQELQRTVRGKVSFDPVIRGIYSTDASHYQMTPQCVVEPLDEDDVVAALRVASQSGLAVTPRGAATALSGQTFGRGMVLDASRHMNQVLEVNVDECWARVQPGVVRDQLNAQLKPLGLQFAPDPATSSRATVGGMIGNNSSGTRSIVYGKTIDHTLACRVALADGEVLDFEECNEAAWRAKTAGAGREAELYRSIEQIVTDNRSEILARYPRVMRRVAGYNLDEFVDGAGYTGPIGPRAAINAGTRPWNLSNLIVGSEGTLATLLDAKIRLVPLPNATAVCVVHFTNAIDALAAVPAINEHGPSAVELLDRGIMREARINPATRDMAGWVEGDPAAVLLTEFFAETPAEAEEKVRAFAAAMRNSDTGYAHPTMLDPRKQADVWETRKLGLGLISNVRGPVKGQAFVEDACVPVENLAEYIERLERVCEQLAVDFSMYAHASVGVIHFRPALDLHRADHREKMKQIADAAFDMVMHYGGVFSGEHGDGQLRGEFVPRQFGPQLYEALRQVKRAFDPENRMNPGKVVDAPSMIDPTSLRYGDQYRTDAVPTEFHYRSQDGFRLAVEQCNGVGACRKIGAGTMCPSYMATRDEKDSTRGRANALRLAMSGQLPGQPLEALGGDGVHDVLQLCLSCKACKSECPNSVDMSRMKADALQLRYDQRGIPLSAKIVGRLPEQARRFAGSLAWAPKLLQSLPGARRILERFGKIDRRRHIPQFAPQTLAQLLAERDAPATLPDRGAVVLFDDTYARFMEPHVGVAAVDLLEGLGYQVLLANAGCCQRTRISQGLLHEAKTLGAQTLANLDRFAQQGLPILCLEPSCASALTDDLPDLIDDAELGARVAAQVQMIDVFLDRQGVPLASDQPRILLHGHCHQKALYGTGAIKRQFGKMSGVECCEVDSGCCGMAGSFGYEHYDLSEKIGEDRLFPAVREAAARGETIVACGISCRHQLKDFLGVDAKHWVEVVRPG
ncbi:MAG: FAD-binding protein [Planctomycetales bacterium]|nr:FAD-binding protein [Planctomycetales bacterium]